MALNSMPRRQGQAAEMGAEAAALRDEGEGPRRVREVVAGQQGQAGAGVVDAEAVGPDDAEPSLAGQAQGLALQFLSLRPRLAEAGGHDHHRLDAQPHALAQCVHALVGGYGEVDQFGHLGQGGDVGVGGQAHDLAVPGVDGIDPSLEAHGQQGSEEEGAEFERFARGAHQGQAGRVEDLLQARGLLGHLLFHTFLHMSRGRVL